MRMGGWARQGERSTPTGDRSSVSPAPASNLSDPGSMHTDPEDDSRPATRRELQRTAYT